MVYGWRGLDISVIRDNPRLSMKSAIYKKPRAYSQGFYVFFCELDIRQSQHCPCNLCLFVFFQISLNGINYSGIFLQLFGKKDMAHINIHDVCGAVKLIAQFY